MDRLDAMSAFVTAVDSGSLASAARRLGHSPATVTRAITLLEDRLGARLLHRTTRAMRLTEVGETYLATCRQVLAALDAAERGVGTEQAVPSGLLTLTAPALFGQLKLRPVLDRYLDAHPDVRARLLLLDRIVNMVEEGVDVAIRLAHLPDSELVALRLGEVRRIVCASPGYISRRGAPVTPADLTKHATLTASEAATEAFWSFATGPGRTRRGLMPAGLRPRLMVNGSAAAIDAALEDHGIIRVMSYQVAAHIEAGRLLRLLPEYEPPPIPVHIVMPPGRAASARLRTFIDFSAPLLKAELERTAEVIASTRR